MANRPVFAAAESAPHFKEYNVEFTFFPGFSLEQKRRSIASLHQSFLRRAGDCHVLEVSRRSENPLGESLSAFRLLYHFDGRTRPVECVFQSSKQFENGGPYRELLEAFPADAKRDMRLRESGRLTAFVWQEQTFPLEPKTYFYDWIYLSALAQNPEISDQLLQYDAFTDIEFNPQKSINCQARSCAIFVSLVREGRLDAALESPAAFLKTVYGGSCGEPPQLTLF